MAAVRGFRRRPRSGQRGQAVLVLLLMLGIVCSLFVYQMVDPAQATVRREARTQAVMREVREALIGWSVQRTPSGALPNARPGELPCPDISPLDGFEDGNCAAGVIGRVPWKTLGIPEPTDETGETLWYAIAGPFRIWNTNPNPINSDTNGNLTVYRDSTATALTTEAVAIIFAPGASLGAQARDTGTALCPTTGTTIPRNTCAANYLETAATVNNATIGGPFIAAQATNTFNDKLLVLTTGDLITVVEQRVARELLALLTAYSTAPGKFCSNNCYTGADKTYTNEEDDEAVRGWLPLCQAESDDWEDLGIDLTNPPLSWLTNNDWWKVIYYAVAPDKTEHFPTISGTLTVDGAPAHVVLITPGPAPAGVTRPSLATSAPYQRTPVSGCIVGPALSTADARAYWQQYLDPNDPLNYDFGDNTYATPSSTAYARNRLYVIRP